MEDVEQFEEIDNNLQIKNFLLETRELLKSMIRTVNIKNESVHIIDNISGIYPIQILIYSLKSVLLYLIT